MFVLQYILTYHNNYSHCLACRLPPCSNGSAFVSMCHTLQCCVMSSVILYSFMILSNHLFLGLPLLLFPCTCITSSWWYPPLSSLTRGHVLTFLSRFCLRKVVIVSMVAFLQMSSFLMWSFLVFPLAHLSILISVVCSFFQSWTIFLYACKTCTLTAELLRRIQSERSLASPTKTESLTSTCGKPSQNIYYHMKIFWQL